MNRLHSPGSVLLGSVLATGFVALATSTPAPAAPATAPATPAVAAPGGVEADWVRRIERQIAASEYDITWQSGTSLPDLEAAWQAPNRVQGFRTYFEREGIRLVPRRGEARWELRLSWVGYGRAGQSWPVPDAVHSPAKNRIDYARGDLIEWYVNGPRGLEQGFTLPFGPKETASRSGDRPIDGMAADPPGGGGEVPIQELIHLELALDGPLSPVFGADGQSIDFLLDGVHVLHYDDLVVTDDAGRTLPAWFEGTTGSNMHGLRIVVDARDAVFPITVDPLATSAAWTTEVDQADAWLGRSVATAGDVNGDGYSDVLVGAHLYDHGEIDEGAAFLFLGSASGLSASPDWTADGDQAGAHFAFSLATAGDVDGDGYSDVIVGAPFHANGEISEGAAFVYFGSASGLPASPNWTGESDQVGAEFGYSVGAAGDVDGDGIGDVIVGARSYDNPELNEGRAFVYFGSSGSIPSTSPDWTGEVDQPSAQFGRSVGTAGDVNKDGYADIVVGARDYDGGMLDEGAAFLYLGSASGPTTSPDWTVEGNQPIARLGGSVGTAGDVNGDGYADVIVGAAFFDNGESNEGLAYVYLGSGSIPWLTAHWTAEIDQSNALFGAAAATAGDVNGDGYADVIVGAEQYANGEMDEGGAWIYLGSSAGLSTNPVWTVESDQVGARLGFGVACAGDVNGDGHSDVIVGAQHYDNGENDEGRAWLYHGGPSGPSTSEDWSAESSEIAAQLGFSVASAGDVNGDGYADVIVGAPYYDDGGTDRGNAWVYEGSATGPSGSPDWVGSAGTDFAEYGGSVASAGDVNGDGYADVIIGAGNYDGGETAEGAAFIHFGSSTGLPSSADVTFEFNLAGARLGSSVASAGDVNGDGFSDVVIGAPGYSNGESGEGGAFLWHGHNWPTPSTPNIDSAAWTAESDQSTAMFGSTVASAGDVDGDGFSDVVVGAWNYSNGETAEGAAWVYLGSESGLSASADWQAEGNQPGAWFGRSAATAGDVGGDGYSDVIVGAPRYDNGESDEGTAFLFLGGAFGLSTGSAWTTEGDEINANLGDSVNTAGDVNGDGFADVLVGTRQPTTGGRALLFPGSALGLASDPAWTADSGVGGAFLSTAVASAGDVNGDGFADLLVGVRGYSNGELSEGGAFVYYGSGGGRVRLPRQLQVAGPLTPISPLGRSDDADSFALRGKGISPFGRVRQRAEVEVKPLGTPFDGSGTTLTSWVSAPETNLVLTISGLTSNTVYRWRARPLFDPATSPYQQHGPWFTIPWNGWPEADLRTTPIVDLELIASDAADPVLLGCTIDWEFTVTNHGPDTAESLDLLVFPTPGTIAASDLVGLTPNDGTCGTFFAGGAVTAVSCAVELLPVGGEFTLELSIKPTSTGTLMADATATLDAGVDPDAGNDTDSVDTTVVDTAIGDQAWNDADGDGIREAGEAGEPNVLVALYDGGGSPLDVAFTDASGAYGFTGVTCGSSYSLRFIAPPNQILTLQDKGGDDGADSDADPLTGETPVFTLLTASDLTRWDAGVLPCVAPDEPVYIAGMRLTDDGSDFPILDFQDPNQPVQVTGYHIYRSSDSTIPKSSWPLVATDVVDMDAATPDNQWVDTSGDVSPTGIWYYNVAAYNNRCSAVGPL